MAERVRRVRPEADAALAAELVALQRSSYRVEADLIGAEDIPGLTETAAELVAADLTWLAAADDSGLVGAVAWSEGAEGLDIDRLVVAPRAFRRGVATALVRGVLRCAASRPVTVSTGRANQPARRLYKGLGFRSEGDREVRPGLWITSYRHDEPTTARDLTGPRITSTPVRPEHVTRLREIHRLPGVVRWWQEPEVAWPLAAEEDTTSYAVLLDGAVVGFAQWYAEDRDEFERAGLDLFLDPEVHGRGLGTEVVRLLCAHLVDEHGFHRLVIDPAADNAAAIACYAKVGFRPVGVLREYGRDRHGEWYDGLLMDLLAGELVRS